MRLIIAGGRDITDRAIFRAVIRRCQDWTDEATELVCGMARGVDTMAYNWAKFYKIPIKEFHPDWKRYGPAAGPIRNEEMARYGDRLIAILKENSKGTKNMIANMDKLKKPVRMFMLTNTPHGVKILFPKRINV